MVDDNGTTENDDQGDVNSVANVVQYAQDNNPVQLKTEFGALIGSKIMDRIETRRQEISTDIFGK